MDAEETEFMENVFDMLCSALGEPEVRKSFLEVEGVDLMVLMLKYAFLYNRPASYLTKEQG